MKYALFFLFFPLISFAQPIKTKAEAENFIVKHFKYYEYRYERFEIDTNRSAMYDTFKEGDFDHDGQKDFLVSGIGTIKVRKDNSEQKEIIIFIGNGRTFRKANLPYRFMHGLRFSNLEPIKVFQIEKKDYILIKRSDIEFGRDSVKVFYDTIFVRNDHLIPFSDNPSTKEIKRIDFKTSHCFGSCPVFELNINSNLYVEYNGIEYVDKKGNYQLRIDKKDWDYLVNLIQNIRVEDLQESYSVNWTDDQTTYLTVHYKDGSKKSIEDYGMVGTFGLSILYNFMFELRKF